MRLCQDKCDIASGQCLALVYRATGNQVMLVDDNSSQTKGPCSLWFVLRKSQCSFMVLKMVVFMQKVPRLRSRPMCVCAAAVFMMTNLMRKSANRQSFRLSAWKPWVSCVLWGHACISHITSTVRTCWSYSVVNLPCEDPVQTQFSEWSYQEQYEDLKHSSCSGSGSCLHCDGFVAHEGYFHFSIHPFLNAFICSAPSQGLAGSK